MCFCSVLFSLFSFFSPLKVWVYGIFVFILCALSHHLHHLAPLAFACDRGQIVHTAPSLCPVWFSLLADPSPDSQRMAAKLVRLWSSNKLLANKNTWKKAAAFISIENEKRGITALVLVPAKWVQAILIESLNMRSVRYADICPYLLMLQVSHQNCFSDIVMKQTVWNSPKCLIFRYDAYTLCGAKPQSIVFNGHLASRNSLPLRLLWLWVPDHWMLQAAFWETSWSGFLWTVICFNIHISELQKSYFKVIHHVHHLWIIVKSSYQSHLKPCPTTNIAVILVSEFHLYCFSGAKMK